MRDFILYSEDVRHLAVVTLRPQMTPVRGGDELGDNPNAATRTPYAAFEDIGNAEDRSDLANVLLLAFERKGGSSCDDF